MIRISPPRKRLWLVIVLITVGLALFRFFHSSPDPITPPPRGVPITAPLATGGSPTPVRHAAPQPASRDVPRATSTLPSRLEGEDRMRLLNEDAYADWKAPIEFYGVVWDDYRRPMADVAIRFSWEEESPEKSITTNVTSGSDGRFALIGQRGKTLLVEPSRDGYSVSRSTPRVYEFGNPYESNYHRPHPAHPVVFHLHRRSESASLIEHQLGFALKADERFGVDLATGERLDRGGDLMIRFIRSEQGADGLCRWLLELTAEGILESTEEFMFLAPAEGYGNSILLRGEANLDGGDPVERWFYLRSRNGGMFARVKTILKAGCGERSGGLAIDSIAATDGTRNLE